MLDDNELLNLLCLPDMDVEDCKSRLSVASPSRKVHVTRVARDIAGHAQGYTTHRERQRDRAPAVPSGCSSWPSTDRIACKPVRLANETHP